MGHSPHRGRKAPRSDEDKLGEMFGQICKLYRSFLQPNDPHPIVAQPTKSPQHLSWAFLTGGSDNDMFQIKDDPKPRTPKLAHPTKLFRNV